jgi:hypothetical protein
LECPDGSRTHELILGPEKTARAAAAAPDIVGQGLPSARIVREAQRFRNRRKTRCNKNEKSSFSKQSLDRLRGGMKDSAYWPAIFGVGFFSSITFSIGY